MRARLVALALVVGSAACGGDDGTSVEARRATTTTVRPTSTSTSTTTSATADDYETGGEPRFPPPVTAPVPTQGEPMADGTHAVYLEGVDVEAGTVTVDVIQFLTGDEADEAYRKETGEDGDVPNDYFIRNASQDQRQVRVADAVSVTVAWDGDDLHELREREMALAELPAYLAGRRADGNDGAVFWVAVEYETVTELFEQYLP